MFEGVEKEGKIGTGGAYIVDVTDKGIAKAEAKWGEGGVSAMVGVEVDVIEILKLLAAKSTNKLDDSIVAMVAGALGR